MFTGVHTTSSSAANKLSTSDMQATLQNAINNGATITAGTGDKVSYDDGQIVNSHGYAVLGTTTRNGQTMVQIRNPWGSGNDPSGSGYSKANGGVSTVPLDEFVKHFDIRIVDTNADKKSSIVGANQNGTNQASLAALLGR
jgi:phosphosulfolactate synthase (CoM biosynthesis protein A)